MLGAACLPDTWLVGCVHLGVQLPLVQQLKGSVYLQWRIQWIDTAVWFYHLPLFDTFFDCSISFNFCHCFVGGLVNLFLFSGFKGSPQCPAFDRETSCGPEALTFDITSVDAFEVLVWDREATLQPCEMMCGKVQVEIHPVFLSQNQGCAVLQSQRGDPDNSREEFNGWRRHHLEKLHRTVGFFLTYICSSALQVCLTSTSS